MWHVYNSCIFTSNNHPYILLCKHASRPIRACILSQLFYDQRQTSKHSFLCRKDTMLDKLQLEHETKDPEQIVLYHSFITCSSSPIQCWIPNDFRTTSFHINIELAKKKLDDLLSGISDCYYQCFCNVKEIAFHQLGPSQCLDQARK